MITVKTSVLKSGLSFNQQILAAEQAAKVEGAITTLFQAVLVRSSDEEIEKLKGIVIEEWKRFCDMAIKEEHAAALTLDTANRGTDWMGEIIKSFFTRISTMNVSSEYGENSQDSKEKKSR